MKIAIAKSLDPMEADRELELLFFKEKGEKDFDLKVWRLQNNKKNLEFLAWVLYNMSKGHALHAERID